ncbi:serine/threonine-protein kinase PEPKR2-like, partial [Trifolium medium]|nr:serine/threonine-protein kinase PEPKR2-like [Trifolium medium]
ASMDFVLHRPIIDNAAHQNKIEESNWFHMQTDDPDECVLIDALATAISHVRISEPKRSRLCSPTGPIVQQGSSNMKANNLCKAF